MGFLDDLIKTVQEAAEEARAQQRQSRSAPDWKPAAAPPAERQTARVVRRVREPEAAAPPPPTPAAAVERPTESTAPPRPRQHPVSADRLRRLLRQPATLRELILLREVLDPPLALRHVRSRPRRIPPTRGSGAPPVA